MVNKYLVTLSMVAVGSLAVFFMFRHQQTNPWTRNGQVRAQIIQITPEVSGEIKKLSISDNQFVKRGDLLFVVDPRHYEAALNQAKAKLAQAKALESESRAVSERAESIFARDKGAIPELEVISRRNALEAATAGIIAAEATVESAELNLHHTKVKAPVDGYVTHLKLRKGSHISPSHAALALVDSNSFWIHGFFKETEVGVIRPGNEAVVTLLSYPDYELDAEVHSIGWGIAQSNGSPAQDLLPSIKPTFEWIRLAQRIPVRVHLKDVPDEVKLRVGATASVLVRTE